MNNQRRKILNKIDALVAEAFELTSEVKQEEEDAFENLPEGVQDSERGEKMQEAATSLDEAETHLEHAQEMIQSAMG